ncbi:hypothetical protein [Spiroplasma endosymbiont of Nomada ruficornis]|uniref:hypothetical protein n=1 Tax=Spiroplasma endosymbiont of Nomada ruficornis TaxID=3066325 RepID=UPI00313D53C5
MTKIKIHILKIEKWNQNLGKEATLNDDDIKDINENENIEKINDDIIAKSTTFS